MRTVEDMGEGGVKKLGKSGDILWTTNSRAIYTRGPSMYHVPWIALISAKRWRLDVLTFLIHGFARAYDFLVCSIYVIIRIRMEAQKILVN